MEEEKQKNYIKWYRDNHGTHSSFCSKVSNLIKELIDANQIPYQSITSRIKEEESFLKKCDREKYSNPIDEIMDIIGIRIIAYINSDVKAICRIIESEFLIDYNNSINKADQLDENQVGYLSVHYIASLNENRTNLPEYKKYNGLRCEIQVRTLLQHAWAEIEHDRNYKFGGVLPKEIRRRFFLASGILEMVDREFQCLSNDIDTYGKEVKAKTDKGDLEIAIDSTSLFEYMSEKFKRKVVASFNNRDKTIIEELQLFEISSIKDIDKLIPSGFVKQITIQEGFSFTGILRALMIIKDNNKYFTKCWRNGWNRLNRATYDLCKKYDLPIDEIVTKYNLMLV